MIDLTVEDVEEARCSVGGESSEKNGALGKHRITQAIKMRAAIRRLIGANYQLRGAALHQKNPLRAGTSPANRQSAVLVQTRTRGGKILDMPEPARCRLREHFAEPAARKSEQAD